MHNTAIIIAGPTASGKTDLALKLAEQINGVIINADSMQLYQDLQIITASPSLEYKQKIPHELYNFIPANQQYSVANYASDASSLVKRVIKIGKVPIIVGGTGMYINALTSGISEIPDISPEIRQETRELFQKIGNEDFYNLLSKLDPKSAAKLHAGDSQRIIRAYEVALQTKKSILDFHHKKTILLPDISFKIVTLSPERKFLYQIINQRFLNMIKQGAIEEIADFNKKYNINYGVKKAIGVSAISKYLENKSTLEQTITEGQQDSRNYAKRQQTWFKHQLRADLVLSFENQEGYFNILENLEKTFL